MPEPVIMTTVNPPREMFENEGAKLQEGSNIPRVGEMFERMEYPDEGDMFQYYYDKPFPAKGQPFKEAVNSILTPKKLIKATAYFLKDHPIFAAFLLILPGFITRRFINSFLKYYLGECVYQILKVYRLEPKRYTKMVRELRRAAFVTLKNYPSRWSEYYPMIVDSLSQIPQWDDAYRYRTQDVLPEINMEAFLKNPSKEIARIAHLQVSRERGWVNEKGKFMVLGQALRLIMFFNPTLKRFVKDYVKELNMDEIKFDEADEYHNLIRPDYDIHGWPIEFRQAKYITIMTKFSQENAKRIMAGRMRNDAINTFNSMQQRILSEEGTPVIVFYAIRDPENGERAVVKMLES